MLLERYAVVSREAALAEELPGGWSALQPVLAAMDDAGQVRRGYWVAGLSGAQYAQPGTIDRMRGHRGDDDRGDAPSLLVLTAIDPANPWGSLLPWPETTQADSRPRRVAGAWVALVDGTPLLWLGAGGRQLVTFRESDERRVALVPAALRALVAARRRRGRSAVVIERIDGEPADASALTASLLAAGWVRDYRGLGLAS